MLLPIIIGGVIGAAAAAHFVARTRERVAQAAKEDSLVLKLGQLSQSIRGRARQSLLLRRRKAALQQEMARLGPQLLDERERLAETDATMVRTYVLNDRKMPGDIGYVFTISHPAFQALAPGAPPGLADSWRAGRRCIVWAADPERATKRAALRCSPQRGYVYGPTLTPLG
jgi:hypothetical protein